jgi:hypothetical protein
MCRSPTRRRSRCCCAPGSTSGRSCCSWRASGSGAASCARSWKANVQRLRAIGFVLVVGAPFVELFTYALRTALFSNVPPYPSLNLGSAGFGVPGNALLGGLGAFILAEVLAYGLRLREDVEATI